MIDTDLLIKLARYADAASVPVTLLVRPEGLLIKAQKGPAKREVLVSYSFLTDETAFDVEVYIRHAVDQSARAVESIYADHIRSGN